jgi:hypothetical protein
VREALRKTVGFAYRAFDSDMVLRNLLHGQYVVELQAQPKQPRIAAPHCTELSIQMRHGPGPNLRFKHVVDKGRGQDLLRCCSVSVPPSLNCCCVRIVRTGPAWILYDVSLRKLGPGP